MVKYPKYKDDSPQNTIMRIRKILHGINLVVTEKWIDSKINGLYSVRLEIVDTSIGVNGKGTTKLYALASAYGELIERIQNGMLIKNYKKPQKYGFKYEADEIEKDIDYYLNNKNTLVDNILINFCNKQENIKFNINNINDLHNNKEEKYRRLKKWSMLEKTNDGKFTSIPYYNVFSQKEELLPYVMKAVYGSNGMASGNTFQEAIVQAISEIIERYVQITIIKNKITPPEIPIEYIKEQFSGIFDYIKQIVSNRQHSVKVLDCSLGEGYPVVAVAIINKTTQQYIVNFGCHPNKIIALERCFTEIFQGRTLSDVQNKFSYDLDYACEIENILSLLKNSIGIYPIEFFEKCSNYDFNKNNFCNNYSNNSEMLDYYKKFLKNKNLDLVIRNVSFLGFPSVHVIIPSISEVYNRGELYINYTLMIRKAKKMISRLDKLTNDELSLLAEFVDYNRKLPHNKEGMKKYYSFFTNEKFLESKLSEYLFLLYGYIKMKNWSRASEICEIIIQNNYEKSYFYKCIKEYVKGLSLNYENNKIRSILANFFNEETIVEVENLVNNGTILEEKFLIQYDKTNQQDSYLEFLSDNLNKKKKKLNNVVI